jgi:hypothetical protein
MVLELGGEIILTRKFVETVDNHENAFTLHTNIKRGTKANPTQY